MVVRVRLNPAGIREVLTSAGVESELMSIAEHVAAAARASAPVDSGEYAASIKVFSEQHADRVVAHIAATAPHAMLVEANTGNLARALGGV